MCSVRVAKERRDTFLSGLFADRTAAAAPVGCLLTNGCIHQACLQLLVHFRSPAVYCCHKPFTPCAPFARPSPCALPPCVRYQGLKGLRGLKVLRLAHNQLSSLEGLGQATQLEVLDATGNSIRDLAGGRWACGERVGEEQRGRRGAWKG